jgi:hypothetical protein
VVCVNCGFNVAEGRALQTEVEVDEQTEAEVGKPKKRDRGKASDPGAGGGTSLVEQQRNAEQPEAKTQYQAAKSREESRRAFAEELQREHARRVAYRYPLIMLGVAGLVQLLLNLSLANGFMNGLAAATVALGGQLLVLLPLSALVLGLAIVFGMRVERPLSGWLIMMAIALVAYVAGGLVTAVIGLPGPLAFFNLLILAVVAVIVAAGLSRPLFRLDYVEAAYLAMALLVVEVGLWAFSFYAVPALHTMMA